MLIGSEILSLSSGRFDDGIPKSKKYLLKYFSTPVESEFLRYYILFGNYTKFSEHTGYIVDRRWLRRLRSKLEKIEKIHDHARKTFDISLVAEIESGKWVLNGKN